MSTKNYYSNSWNFKNQYAIKYKKCHFHENQDQILEPCNRKTNLNLNALEIKQSPKLKQKTRGHWSSH